MRTAPRSGGRAPWGATPGRVPPGNATTTGGDGIPRTDGVEWDDDLVRVRVGARTFTMPYEAILGGRPFSVDLDAPDAADQLERYLHGLRVEAVEVASGAMNAADGYGITDGERHEALRLVTVSAGKADLRVHVSTEDPS